MLTFNISILYNVINILVLFVLLKIFLFKPVNTAIPAPTATNINKTSP